MFTYEQEQKLNISLDEAWDFFSSPKNLKEITPDYMGFDILTKLDGEMYAGQIIQYKVRPLFSVPVKWVTEITHVQKPHFFIDNQLIGPYKIWHHQHHFKALDNGTVLMTDIINYQPPIPLLEWVMNELFIKSKLQEIFDYRKIYLEKKFNNK